MRKSRRRSVMRLAAPLICLVLSLGGSSCAEGVQPRVPSDDLNVGEELFKIVCLRIARGAHPEDPEGTVYKGPCAGEGELPEGESPRLLALLKRRPEVLAAL